MVDIMNSYFIPPRLLNSTLSTKKDVRHRTLSYSNSSAWLRGNLTAWDDRHWNLKQHYPSSWHDSKRSIHVVTCMQIFSCLLENVTRRWICSGSVSLWEWWQFSRHNFSSNTLRAKLACISRIEGLICWRVLVILPPHGVYKHSATYYSAEERQWEGYQRESNLAKTLSNVKRLIRSVSWPSLSLKNVRKRLHPTKFQK